MSRFSPSDLALIGVNLLPIPGVLWFGWDAFSLVFLYWLENVLIGGINILKLLTLGVAPRSGPESDLPAAARLPVAGFMAAFFAFHYGMFCFVHGIFVLVLFQREPGGGSPFDLLGRIGPLVSGPLLFATLALAGSHLYSFFYNFVRRGEYRRMTLQRQMGQPYARVVVLHVAILAGAFITAVLNQPTAILILLVLGKTALDFKMHHREHRQDEILDPSPTTH